MKVIIEREFTQFVKARLESKGWSLRELSRRTGIAVSNLSQYLNHKNSPGADQMERILSALGSVAHLTFSDAEENLVPSA
jgi:transcriptional regulator with XRE-family HTH domain